MHVHAVIYHPSEFSDQLFHDALSCLDAETQTRIKRFYHREDACRSLIGHLLIRKLLTDQGVQPSEFKFSKTREGKPYIANQQATPPIAYNIAHDNSLIALVTGVGHTNPPAFSFGIDVMKVKVPGKRNNSIDSLIEGVQEQLTPTERTLLSTKHATSERLERFFQIWTIKEAYTKALGLGLGFDFKRIEVCFTPSTTATIPMTVSTAAVNTPNCNSKEQPPIRILIDGESPPEWSFHIFTVPDGEDRYIGVTAEQASSVIDISISNLSSQVMSALPPEQLTVQDAVSFAQQATSALRS